MQRLLPCIELGEDMEVHMAKKKAAKKKAGKKKKASKKKAKKA